MLHFIYYTFIGITFLATLAMLLTNHILYLAFLLLCVLLGLSGIYVMLGADFIAIAQIVVYVGGVLVLLLFGIMFTHKSSENYSLRHTAVHLTAQNSPFFSLLIGLSMFSLLVAMLLLLDFENTKWIRQAIQEKKTIQQTTVYQLGVGWMTYYILVFELIAFLLLLALVGALSIAGWKEKNIS